MVLVGGIELIHLTGEKALTMMSISPAVLSFQPAPPRASGRAAQLQPAKLSSHCLGRQPGTNQPTNAREQILIGHSETFEFGG